jgi:hypothetical protein
LLWDVDDAGDELRERPVAVEQPAAVIEGEWSSPADHG